MLNRLDESNYLKDQAVKIKRRGWIYNLYNLLKINELMAEMVGFGLTPSVDSKGLRGFLILSFRQKRSKAWVETRIKHAGKGTGMHHGVLTS